MKLLAAVLTLILGALMLGTPMFYRPVRITSVQPIRPDLRPVIVCFDAGETEPLMTCRWHVEKL